MSLNLQQQGYPATVDPDLPSGRQHGYRDVTRQREIAGNVVRGGAHGSLDDPWDEAVWAGLPAALRVRLVRASSAVERRPHDERAALTYRGRVAEAVTYLTSATQGVR